MINENAVLLFKEVAKNKNVTKHRRQFCHMIKISITLNMHALLSKIKSRGGYKKSRKREPKF